MGKILLNYRKRNLRSVVNALFLKMHTREEKGTGEEKFRKNDGQTPVLTYT